jgi:ABC-type enterochelin transport system substrate-binding protein
MFGLKFIGETVGKIFGTDKAAAALIDNVDVALKKFGKNNQV